MIRQNITSTAQFEHLSHYGSALSTHPTFEAAVAAATEWQRVTDDRNLAQYASAGLDTAEVTRARAFIALRIESHAGSSEACRWELIDGQAVLVPSGQGGLSAEQAAEIRTELAARRAQLEAAA